MKSQILLALILVLAFTSHTLALKLDPNSKSNIDQFYTEQVTMNWQLDLLAKTLKGTSDIAMITLADNAQVVKLDVWDELDIDQAKCLYSDSVSQLQPVTCTIDKTLTDEELQGYALLVNLKSPKKKDDKFTITVSYFIDNQETEFGQMGSMAIKFSDYESGSTRKYPSAFSYSQMIYARSLAPFQDSPSVKFKWTANVVVTPNVTPKGFVMSGYECKNYTVKETPDNITFCYESGSTTFPSYQIAFFAGDLKQQDVLGTNIRVITFQDWMEQSYEYLELSGQYFSALTSYMEGAPYPFSKINIAIPPIDFPYSSMENGNLIFLSKTLIPDENNMGDELGYFALTKSLAKAWFGQVNTVSNWQSFWLTEGISTFVARQAIRLIEDYNYEKNNLVGNESFYNYVQEIYETLGTESNTPYLTLTPDPKGVDPYRALNPLIREKSNQFLEHIQDYVMNQKFYEMQAFLVQWITNPVKAQNSTEKIVLTYDTEDFNNNLKEFLRVHFAIDVQILTKVDFDHWVYGKGMPKKSYQDYLLALWDSPSTEEVLFLAEQVVELRGVAVPKRFLEIAKYWNQYDLLLFLSYIQNNINYIKRSRFDFRLFKTIDQILDLQNHRALEVRTTFVELSLRTSYIHNVLTSLSKILVSTGNLEIILPLYQTLVDIGLRNEAKELYKKAQKYYHPVAVSRIKALLNQP